MQSISNNSGGGANFPKLSRVENEEDEAEEDEDDNIKEREGKGS